MKQLAQTFAAFFCIILLLSATRFYDVDACQCKVQVHLKMGLPVCDCAVSNCAGGLGGCTPVAVWDPLHGQGWWCQCGGTTDDPNCQCKGWVDAIDFVGHCDTVNCLAPPEYYSLGCDEDDPPDTNWIDLCSCKYQHF